MINLKRVLIFPLAIFFSLSISANNDLPEIEFQKFSLPNGLRVIVHEDRKIPVVAVNVWYHVGSKDELPGKTGFAHLFEGRRVGRSSLNVEGVFVFPSLTVPRLIAGIQC